MKKTWINISVACTALVFGPMAAYADHDKDCKATHGTVSAKTDNSITVNGKAYSLGRDAKITRHSGDAATLAAVNVGDKVCLETPADSRQVTKLVVMDRNNTLDSKDRTYATERISELQRKTHEQICEGHHGKVTAKSDSSVTIDGKVYAMKLGTQERKGEGAVVLKGVNLGDTVCYVTQEAADGSKQVAKLIAIDPNDRVRVREKENGVDVDVKKDKDNKVETPEIEVK